MISSAATRPLSKKRLFQNKLEAFLFYRFVSIIYDPATVLCWDEDVRKAAFEPADLSDPNLKVVDVGGGTGVSGCAIVEHINPKNLTILDQSPHQLDKARQKEALKECTIIQGDAEDLPFPADYFDRYTSAGR